jgi:gamma-glutamylcyclotransferase (GGCT)/AIG2-like uncharacterized protein YtfP
MAELLFVYGTLKDPTVQQKTVGRKLVGEPDILENHTTQQIIQDGNIYLILVESEGENVSGLVLEISSADFPALDEYEGDEYKRVKVQLRSGKSVWAYKKNEYIRR